MWRGLAAVVVVVVMVGQGLSKNAKTSPTDENINGIRGTSRFLRGFFLICAQSRCDLLVIEYLIIFVFSFRFVFLFRESLLYAYEDLPPLSQFY